MSETIVVKTKPCTVCGEYEVWSLDRDSVIRWREGEHIQNVFPDMSAGDREVLISGTHPACWDKLFPEEEGEHCDRCNVDEVHLNDQDCYAYEMEAKNG